MIGDTKCRQFFINFINIKALAEIAQPSVPKNYFKVFRHALNATRIFGRLVVCSLGVTDNPLIVAEVADLLLRLDEAEWVVTGGLFDHKYYISVRAKEYGRDAWSLLREVLDGEGSFGVAGPINLPAANAAAGQHGGIAICPMIATGEFVDLWCATKLPGDNHQSLVQQSPL